MKKWIRVTLIILLVIVILLIFGFSRKILYCNVPGVPDNVSKNYENPKYCEQDSDCVIQGDNCGAVNKYNAFSRKCAGLECLWILSGAKCINNTCVPTGPTPP